MTRYSAERARAAMRRPSEELFRRLLKQLEPLEPMTVSEWADRYRRLSTESAAEPGKWRTDRAPYQRDPQDAIADRSVKKVVLMWGAQMGKTDSAILNPLGYYMQRYPSPIMILQPSVEMAETVSKNRLSPMLRDTPVLAELVANKSRDKNNTILEKQFPGGYVVLTGANSPSALASRPIRVLFADEIDRYPPTAGKEGDPLSLAEKRMTAFWDKKEVVTSTPTIKGTSRIEIEYENSTREVWNVPCPCCGAYQPIKWANIKFDAQAFRDETDMEVLCECAECGVVSSEAEWRAGFSKGEYIAERPGLETRGFFVNALMSTLCTWKEIVQEYLKAVDESKTGNMELLKTWVNTRLAETWEIDGVEADDKGLLERLEDYGCEVPDEVIYLTCGVDTQDDRFEYEVVGWGVGKESWGIEYGRIYGDLKQPEIWEQLDEILTERTWQKADGTRIGIAKSCLDTGGHFTLEAYRFCLPRFPQVYAIKGGHGMETPFISNPTRSNRVKVPLYTLGVSTGKVTIYNRLAIDEPGPGYCHFPAGGRGYDENYFKGLTAEKLVTRYKAGRKIMEWQLKDGGFRRNEPLDTRNYATAALEIGNLTLDPNAQKKKLTRGRRQLRKGIEI